MIPLLPHVLLPCLRFLIQLGQTPVPTPSPAHLCCLSLESSLFPSSNLIHPRSGSASPEKPPLTLASIPLYESDGDYGYSV